MVNICLDKIDNFITFNRNRRFAVICCIFYFYRLLMRVLPQLKMLLDKFSNLHDIL
jgi:hypothetical protein